MLRGGKRDCIWGMFGKIRDVKTREDLCLLELEYKHFRLNLCDDREYN